MGEGWQLNVMATKLTITIRQMQTKISNNFDIKLGLLYAWTRYPYSIQLTLPRHDFKQSYKTTNKLAVFINVALCWLLCMAAVGHN